MTAPADLPLYATDEEIARVVYGKGPKALMDWKTLAATLARQGMPQLDPMTKRRFWPAVREFLYKREGIGSIQIEGPTWEENFDDPPRRARPRGQAVR